MTDPRPNNEPRPRVMPEQAPAPFGGVVLTAVSFVLGIVWVVTFVMRLSDGSRGWFDTWWPLVSAAAFLALGVSRVLRARRLRPSPDGA